MAYGVSSTMTNALIPFFEAIEAKTDIVRDVSISQTTLEDVFIQVTADTHVIEALQT